MIASLESKIHSKSFELKKVAEYLTSAEFKAAVDRILFFVKNSFGSSSSLYLGGNGGSFAEALHIAAEFAGRFKSDRNPLPAYALAANQSTLTAIGNDYSFETIFSREIFAYCNHSDTVILLSTSGHSPNIISALNACSSVDCNTILLTSINCNLDIPERGNLFVCKVPFEATDSIQEVHLIMLHLVCSAFEPSA
jgi:D-sedoheptulose 7-phosphate isomerase